MAKTESVYWNRIGLQHQEDVAVSIKKQEKRKRRTTLAPQKQSPSQSKKPNVTLNQLEAHKFGERVGISDLDTGRVSYESHLTDQKEKHRVECDCGKSFASVQNMKRHQKTHTRSRAKFWKCTYCSKSFGEHGMLKRHLTIHTGERPFQCEFCPKRFYRSGHLKSHHRLHTGEKPFQCEFCPKRFNQSGHLKSHHRVHTGEKPFQCEFCPKRFNQSGLLKSHHRVHTGEKPFQCEPIRFNQCGHPKSRDRVLTGEKPYECKFCHIHFAYPSKLKCHLMIHTGEKPFQCEFCPKSFNRSGSLKLHRRLHTGEKPYKCKLCHQRYASHSGLDYHLKSHVKPLMNSQNVEDHDTCKLEDTALEELDPDATDIGTDGDEMVAPITVTEITQEKKPSETPKLSDTGYQCDYCSKVCKSASGLTNHQKSHFSHKCESCGKVFRDPSTLQGHISEYHPDQEKLAFTCRYCLKCFPTDVALQSHVESSHTNQKEHMTLCEWCGKTVRKSYLPEHFRIHQQIPHECEFCSKIYTAPSYLKRHIKRFHKHRAS